MATAEELLRELRANPELREQLRRDLLTDELLRVPDTMAQIAGQLSDLTERVDMLVRQVADLVRELHRVGQRTDRSLDALVELRYYWRPYAYFGTIATRLRALDGDALEDILEPAVAAARVSEMDRYEVLRSDGVFRGSAHGRDLYLVMEASFTVDETDVRRAAARAEALRRTGRDVIAVAAGEELDAGVRDLAQNSGVWIVTNGSVVTPGEAA